MLSTGGDESPPIRSSSACDVGFAGVVNEETLSRDPRGGSPPGPARDGRASSVSSGRKLKGDEGPRCERGSVRPRIDVVLYEFLSANRAEIIARTKARVAVKLAEEELAHGIPFFLDQLITALRLSQSSPEAIGEIAARHGRDLLEQGFTVAQVVHDYGGLCKTVTEFATETHLSITAAEFRLFNGCLDDAIAQAVTAYGQRRERQVADEGKVRAAELAHELRNALAAAMLAFETITTGTVGARGSTASLLGRSLKRAADLVAPSIAVARLEAGIRMPERVSIRRFMEEIEVGASLQATAQSLSLAVAVGEEGVDVEVDRALLAAAVGNLLQNAFKFTRAHGRVWLRTAAAEDRVRIEIEDECGGLPPGDPTELFRRFEQRGRDRTGLGLGLAISRKSVEADGGEINVRDVPGMGCVFTIELPRLSHQP
jgi:signal transduction histidine kinase